MMTNPDIFLLQKSDLNPFLFSQVGTELNGSELTILSVLARRGLDPWLEARRLSKLPKVAAALWLAKEIRGMPLISPSIAEAGPTAARLILLLPVQSVAGRESEADRAVARLGTTKMAKWTMIAMLLGALAVGTVGAMKGSVRPVASQQANQQDP